MKPTLKTVSVTEADGYLTVRPVWAGVDRSEGTGISVKDRKVADRLVKGLLSGKVFQSEPKVRTDAFGKTYVEAPMLVLGRTLNADLKRLGL